MGKEPVRGFFNGTGNDIYLCLGGVPSKIEICNLGGATPSWLFWDKVMLHNTLTCEGMGVANTGETFNLANGEGVSPYYGGDLMVSSNQTTVEYGDGIYIMADNYDYRKMTVTDTGAFGDASDDDITTWTLDTSGSQTGHFNDGIDGGDVNGTYIGVGSLIHIKANEARIESDYYETCIFSLTANTGETANEVKLMYDVPSGEVTFIGGKYGYKPVPRGQTTEAGVKISGTTYVNGSDVYNGFVAWFD